MKKAINKHILKLNKIYYPFYRIIFTIKNYNIQIYLKLKC